jgi:hypothetical protein
MSIKNIIRITDRINKRVSILKIKYSSQSDASHDLSKLSESIHKLLVYLKEIDHLEPNTTTNTLHKYMNPINLDLIILKRELEHSDYLKIQNGLKVLNKALAFHPSKHSFVEFIILWFYEFIYFI